MLRFRRTRGVLCSSSGEDGTGDRATAWREPEEGHEQGTGTGQETG